MRRLIALLDRLPTVVFVLLFMLAGYQLGRATAGTGSAETDASCDDSGQEETSVGDAFEYVCTMHPEVRQDEPGTCPICAMDLVPASPAGREGGDLALSDEAAALAHVRTEPVVRVPLSREIQVFGRVATQESGDANITAWTAGRIDRLYVETIGEIVRRGQRLARIYSPELVVAQETLIHAREILVDARAAGSELRAHAAQAAAAAAQTELRLLGISDRQIEDLVADGAADETVQIYAPAGGTVMRRFVSEGDHVERGAPLLQLADLTEVWVQLEVYENELPHVREGTSVLLSVPGVSAESFMGEVAFVDPVIDPERRIARARVVVDNHSRAFRPDMFVEATLVSDVTDASGRHPLSVPASAVLWTGRRSVIYIYDQSVAPPVYLPVEVELGERVDDRYVILGGVFLGETVVTNGAFRLDASLQIRGGDSMMNPVVRGEGAGGHDH